MESSMARGAAALRQWTRAALVCLGLAPLPACLDCFDDDQLEASYRAGERSARELNEREFARGYDDGLALTYADGDHDGDAAGYADGYEDGYYGPYGYAYGADQGYAAGHANGRLDPLACDDGASRGYADGDRDGYTTGFDDTYDPAFDDGYRAGFDDGAALCGFRRASARPESAQRSTCEARGYARVLDRSAFARGLDSGRADNPDYQAGYAEAYAFTYPVGQRHGELDGYDHGYRDGHGAGFVAGYELSFYRCYDHAYPDGFDGGYAIGYDDGHATGYDDGYATGYDDGRAQCST